MNKTTKQLSQFFTPAWAAEILFNEHFKNLTDKDLVWEPSCGKGSFLSAIPNHIPAVGSEIDPKLVKIASHNTNRTIYCGDFRTVSFNELPLVTSIIGNPPFSLKVFEEFMQRAENILPLGKKAGFIIPAYFFQTSRTFMRFARKWDISQEMLPRDIFNDGGLLSIPIIWASFIRDNFPKLIGFRLHAEMDDVNNLNETVKEIVSNQIKRSGSVWREALIQVVKDSGGTVTLEQAYRNMQGKRPTDNPFWKEQIRKIIQQHPFNKISQSTYKLN